MDDFYTFINTLSDDDILYLLKQNNIKPSQRKGGNRNKLKSRYEKEIPLDLSLPEKQPVTTPPLNTPPRKKTRKDSAYRLDLNPHRKYPKSPFEPPQEVTDRELQEALMKIFKGDLSRSSFESESDSDSETTQHFTPAEQSVSVSSTVFPQRKKYNVYKSLATPRKYV